MSGKFVISLDCEGKWGMADRIGPEYDFITESALLRAYEQIVDLFALFEIKATFAFVGAFTLKKLEREEYLSQLPPGHYEGNLWKRHFDAAERRGDTDGWFCPDAFDLANNAGHEIACHGFTHIPFDDPLTKVSHIETEMELAVKLALSRNVKLETFVYPRNRVARQDILRTYGIRAYRDLLPSRGRATSLMREAKVWEHAQPFANPLTFGQTPEVVAIPPGYFLNWRAGIRRAVPESVSRARWRSILRSAARTDGVAHLWFHPHNLISGPATISLLKGILRDFSDLRDSCGIANTTQVGLLPPPHRP